LSVRLIPATDIGVVIELATLAPAERLHVDAVGGVSTDEGCFPQRVAHGLVVRKMPCINS
jgi:hypothetical protein